MNNIKRLLQQVAVGLSLVLAIGTASALPILEVDGTGKLTGARNVDVGGTLYDVVIQDGRCIDLFNGCNDVSDFIFQTAAAADLASQALLDQVFIDGPAGAFDADPSLTRGCESTNCFAATPYFRLLPIPGGPRFTVDVRAATNRLPGSTDTISTFSTAFDFDTTPDTDDVYVVWTRSAQVPEPGSLALLGIAGFAGFMANRRRDRKPHINQIS